MQVDAADAAAPQVGRDDILAYIQVGFSLAAVHQPPAAVDQDGFAARQHH